MKKILHLLDLIVNWLVLFTMPFMAILFLLDTIDVFQDPEHHSSVQDQINWMSQGYSFYIVRNVISLIIIVIFCVSALNKLKAKKLWIRVYYSILTCLLIVIFYNLVVNGYQLQ